MQEISSVFSNGNRKFIPLGASCRPGKFKWKKMKEQKKRNVKHFNFKKGSHIFCGRYFCTFVLDKAMRVKVVLLLLLLFVCLFVGGGISQRPN